LSDRRIPSPEELEEYSFGPTANQTILSRPLAICHHSPQKSNRTPALSRNITQLLGKAGATIQEVTCIIGNKRSDLANFISDESKPAVSCYNEHYPCAYNYASIGRQLLPLYGSARPDMVAHLASSSELDVFIRADKCIDLCGKNDATYEAHFQ
jgi:hypothetical protein